MPLDDTVAQLKRLKAQRSRQRELRDLEERKLLDELHDTNRRLKGSPRARDGRKKVQLSKDETVRQMQIQYERNRERNLMGEGRRDYRKKPELPRYNPGSDPKVKQLAETHGRNMESLHSKNKDLERQREEIRRRLEGLGRRPVKEDDSMNGLLQELKDQEARNQRMLEELRRILASQNIPMPPPPATEPRSSNRFVYPIYYGNSLVAEIIAVRQAYIQNGGNDPDILQQLASMQAEAQAIDDSLRNKPTIKIKGGKPQVDHSGIFSLELENERLQRQLLLLQDQNVTARQRRKDDREGRPGRRPRALSQHYQLRPAGLAPQGRRASSNYTQLRPLDVGSQAPLLRRDARYTQLRPLDVKRQAPPPRQTQPPEMWALERTDITAIDPFKEKIDSDLQNKFGYDFGGSRLGFSRHRPPEDLASPRYQGQPVRDRSHVGITTLAPQADATIVNLPQEGVRTLAPEFGHGEPTNEAQKGDNNLTLPPVDPAHRPRQPSVTFEEPNNKGASQRNVNSDATEPLGSRSNLTLNLGGRGPAVAPSVASARTNVPAPTAVRSHLARASYNQPSRFEDEFFANTSRTEVGENPLDRGPAQDVPDNSALWQYHPVQERYASNYRNQTKDPDDNAGEQNAAATEPTYNASRPLPLPRPNVLIQGAAR